MGKRRDKTGRRQILQLHDDRPPVTTSKTPLQNLMQYSDSDEEEKARRNEVTSASDDKSDPNKQIDMEVADFLKEIDALHQSGDNIDFSLVETDSAATNLPTTDENITDPPTSKENVGNSSSLKENNKSTRPSKSKRHKKHSPEVYTLELGNKHREMKKQGLSNSEGRSSDHHANNDGNAFGPWQHCYDESSGYSYFWNVKTNEVTWECPPDYSSYADISMSDLHMDTSAIAGDMQVMPSGSQKKSAAELNEGKIIPITFFEPHVSSEDSSEDEITRKKAKYKKKLLKIFSQSKDKIKRDIGPPLPKGHLLSKSLPIPRKLPTRSSDSIIGPQLPSYYRPREVKVKDESLVSNSDEASAERTNFNLNPSAENGVCHSNQTAHSQSKISSTVEKSCTNEKDKFLVPVKNEKIYGQEPDSTTRKESTFKDTTKPLSKKLMQTLVQYGESGSEDEGHIEKPTIDDTNKYRRDGRQGFGFKRSGSSSNNNWRKEEKDIEKDYRKISFIKSNEILDLNKLNEEKIMCQKAETTVSGEKHKMDKLLSSIDKKGIQQKLNENEGSGILSDTPENMKDAEELSSVIIDKLSFLVIGQAEVPALCQLYIQFQTRYTDWKENALSSAYFLNRLKEAQDYLRQYEMNAMPSGWICDWDRQNKRYFYINERTGQTQWEYPQIANNETLAECTVSSGLIISKDRKVESHKVPQHPLISSSVSEALLPQIATQIATSSYKTNNASYQPETWTSSVNSTENQTSDSPPPSPPGVDKPLPPPPPPLPPPPPPSSPPPPPPDSTELEDEEIADVEMDIDSDDQCSEITVSTSVVSTQFEQSLNSPYVSLPSSSAAVVSTITSDNLTAVKPHQNSTVYSNNDKSINHSLVPSMTYSNAMNTQSTSEAISGRIPIVSSVLNTIESSNVINSGTSQPSTSTSSKPHQPLLHPPKKEKKKCKLSTGLTLKKKNIPSLVQKWQKIKEQQEKDSGNSDLNGRKFFP